ncbi:putative 2-aminoethylphosphonate ABC transporter ATP-binding protein [Herbaspirillum robiniae]|uniref:2-aminoethylphosphonate ABC transporter ATP-binding protein n=1 Tax=Herbaspirillum robiniae TaxID=2014887 RepID=A0A246WUJ2_9BURK|nr:putative 2-aminoethylphosphonate ABC transporter ATP-binding protein [Herbaspirillum robiniae]NUT99974.1 putative 2-aminoethylphosphonate ABC transporter ATP-binding protein [Herbaspirillum robiniae]OWY30740.1 sulfate ABC transporter ATP-binding protein [Herbaspirillum robiniae]
MTQTSSPAAAPHHHDGDESFLSVRGIEKRFGAFTALDRVSLDVRRGEMVCLLGPSGCGKTTLLRTIAGLERQDAGSLHAGGRDISQLPPQSRDYGILFQSYALFPNLTVEDNVGYGLPRKLSRQHKRERVSAMLGMVGLSGSERKYPGQLSGGQQQRVALARALAPSPSLLLLDEPLSALDAQVREHLQLEIRRLQKEFRITTLMVTHDQEEAMVMADRIAVMNRGRIEQFGTPDDIYRRPASPFVADFIGQSNWLPFTRISGSQVAVGSLQLEIRPEEEELANGRLFCRPEAIDLFPHDAAANRFRARVVDRIYLGNRYRLALSCEALPGQTLLADVMGDAHERLAGMHGGDGIWIALPRQALQVFV